MLFLDFYQTLLKLTLKTLGFEVWDKRYFFRKIDPLKRIDVIFADKNLCLQIV